jgi:L-aspartate oxidase
VTASDALRVDVAVVGAGAAGLYAALTASAEGARVALVTRSPLAQTASYWAQGGIAAALARDDSPELHTQDTLAAGRSAARESAVRVLCEESPARVRDLERLGVSFDADRHGNLALGLEGGHSCRRIVHAGGAATGRRITRELSALAAVDERIEVLEPRAATALTLHEGRCVGLVARPRRGDPLPVLARAVVLATGGMAALWARSTNPRGAVGAGLTLAHAAGAELADLEFMQFHPTALRREGPRDGFLITEAVRGEGATLHDERGERFVDELGPRDQVALAIQSQLQRSGEDAVNLDMRTVDVARFPNIAAALDEVGIDPRRDLIPVAPAAHYTMGGVATDLDGRSSVPGLYAVGESACTGLHGANRLASNSLAECFVFGRRAALAATADPEPPASAPADDAIHTSPPSDETRAALWRHAGLQRDAAGLRELLDDRFPLTRLIGASCLARDESRGAHQRTDHPATNPELDHMHTLVVDTDPPRFTEWN